MTKQSSQRLNVELKVFYGPDQKTVLSGFTTDFSEGGLFLKTTFPFKVDEKLTLMFSLPSQTEVTVSCRASIAWVNHDENPCKPDFPAGVGVNFIDIAAEDLESISSFLDFNKA